MNILVKTNNEKSKDTYAFEGTSWLKAQVEESLSNFLKYAGHDLPELTYRMQQLANEVIDLESKKKLSIDALAQLTDTLSWYHNNIELNKQILSDLDKKINQKQHVKEGH